MKEVQFGTQDTTFISADGVDHFEHMVDTLRVQVQTLYKTDTSQKILRLLYVKKLPAVHQCATCIKWFSKYAGLVNIVDNKPRSILRSIMYTKEKGYGIPEHIIAYVESHAPYVPVCGSKGLDPSDEVDESINTDQHWGINMSGHCINSTLLENANSNTSPTEGYYDEASLEQTYYSLVAEYEMMLDKLPTEAIEELLNAIDYFAVDSPAYALEHHLTMRRSSEGLSAEEHHVMVLNYITHIPMNESKLSGHPSLPLAYESLHGQLTKERLIRYSYELKALNYMGIGDAYEDMADFLEIVDKKDLSDSLDMRACNVHDLKYVWTPSHSPSLQHVDKPKGKPTLISTKNFVTTVMPKADTLLLQSDVLSTNTRWYTYYTCTNEDAKPIYTHDKDDTRYPVSKKVVSGDKPFEISGDIITGYVEVLGVARDPVGHDYSRPIYKSELSFIVGTTGDGREESTPLFSQLMRSPLLMTFGTELTKYGQPRTLEPVEGTPVAGFAFCSGEGVAQLSGEVTAIIDGEVTSYLLFDY